MSDYYNFAEHPGFYAGKHPVAADTKISSGGLLAINAAGNALDADDTVAGHVVGRAIDGADSRQRSGYPDLRLIEQASGSVFYLDPKLVEEGSESSTLRTFYFEPKNETLKITDDAVHLLIGIEHDGKAGAWTFTGWRLVDLSTLKVRLKAEFQASNAQLYRKSILTLAPDAR